MTDPRLALVTGAGQGLGRAVAEHLARAGNSLLVADSQFNDASQTAAELRASGHQAFPLELDVCDERGVTLTYAEIESRFGRVDILVNGAGMLCESALVEAMSLKSWETVVRANLTSVFLMSRGAIPLMRRGSWGRIVTLSSAFARGQPGVARSAFVAAQAGVIALSRVLADGLGRDGITVNCVAPSRNEASASAAEAGNNERDWQGSASGSALGRLARHGDIAAGVAWLCSEKAGFFTGIVLDINGGEVMR